jgi:hypothetical protein
MPVIKDDVLNAVLVYIEVPFTYKVTVPPDRVTARYVQVLIGTLPTSPEETVKEVPFVLISKNTWFDWHPILIAP